MSLFENGRKVGYTNSEIRNIIKEQRLLLNRDELINCVLECNNIEDIKILLIDWIDKGLLNN